MINKQRKPSMLRQLITSAVVNNWSEARNASVAQVVAAMLGLSVPIVIGAATGSLQSGVVAALGGLVIGTQNEGGALRDRIPTLVYTLIAGSAATFIGTTLSGRNCTGIFIVAIAALAALFGSISRTLARATTQFIVFLIIAGNMNMSQTHPAGVTMMFALGALWTAALSLSLNTFFQTICPPPDHEHQVNSAPLTGYTAAQLLRRWRRSLSHLKGWIYTLRITLCLCAAEIMRWMLPHDHSYWISLTVALVVHRDFQSALARTFQRALGTFLGVLLISILLLGLPPLWIIIILVALLAAARPVLIGINYVAYVAAVTPLIILLLDFGSKPSVTVIANRLIATFVGCFIALVLGYMVWVRYAGSLQRMMNNKT